MIDNKIIIGMPVLSINLYKWWKIFLSVFIYLIPFLDCLLGVPYILLHTNLPGWK
jgi:hypothetical protein